MTTIIALLYIAIAIEIFWTLGVALCYIREGKPRKSLLPFISCLLGVGFIFLLEMLR